MKLTTSFKNYVKQNWLGAIAFFLCYIAPVLALGLFVSLTKKNTGTSLSIWGIICAGIILLIIVVKFRKLCTGMKHGWVRWALLFAFQLAFWLIVFGLFYTIHKFVDMMLKYWYCAGGIMLLGRVVYLIDEQVKKSKLEVQDG